MTPRDRKPHDHLLEESKRDITGSVSVRESVSINTFGNTGRGNAKESASTSTSTSTTPNPRTDASLGVESNPRNREPQENVSFNRTPS